MSKSTIVSVTVKARKPIDSENEIQASPEAFDAFESELKGSTGRNAKVEALLQSESPWD